MKDFLYFLSREDGRFCKEVNGAVSLTSAPAPLNHTPDGWLDTEIQRLRSTKYFAVERSFSTSLNFVEDGALIVKSFYYNRGIEDKLYLSIAEKRVYLTHGPGEPLLNEQGQPLLDSDDAPILGEGTAEYGYYYTLIYKGEIDFSTFEHDGPKVTLNVAEGGTVKLLKAYESTPFEIPFTKYVLVKMDGIRLQQKATYIVTDGGASRNGVLDDHTIAMVFISQEAINSIGAIDQSRVKVDSNNTADLWNINSWFLLSGSLDTSLTITWDFKATPSLLPSFHKDDGVEMHLEFHVISDASTHPISEVIQVVGGGSAGSFYDQPQHFQGVVTRTIPANSRCILYMSISHLSSATRVNYDAETSSVTLDYTYVHPASYIKAMRPLDLFTAVAAKMGITSVSSALLKKYENVVVTSGDALRGFTTAVVKTSMQDFYAAYNTALSIAMGIINQQLVLEGKADFVDYANPIVMGECKNLKVSPALDYVFSTIKIGYPSQRYDEPNVNGREEFNTTHVYTTGVTRISKELNLVSPYRADCYGAEFIRINTEGKTTTDTIGDNDVFLLHIKSAPATGHDVIFTYYELDRALNPFATGLLQASSVFNLWLSPKQCLLRNGRFVRSCFYSMDNLQLRFQTTEKNASVVINKPGAVVAEKGNILISSLGDRLFTPNLLTFENIWPYDVLELLKAGPKRAIEFSVNGQPFRGLPIKDNLKPGKDEAQTFQLLSAPSNTLTNLISYNG
jgi:hypothetical protein